MSAPQQDQAGFTSMWEFVTADARRWTSQQVDYGAPAWLDTARSRFGPPWHRLSYIRATGEVYAASTVGPVRVLGVVPADEEPGTRSGRNIRPSATWHRTLDEILDGYANPEVNGGFSLEWVAGRLRQAEVPGTSP